MRFKTVHGVALAAALSALVVAAVRFEGTGTVAPSNGGGSGRCKPSGEGVSGPNRGGCVTEVRPVRSAATRAKKLRGSVHADDPLRGAVQRRHVQEHERGRAGGRPSVQANHTSARVTAIAIVPGAIPRDDLSPATFTAGVFKTTDGGATWTAVNSGIVGQ